MMGSDTRALCRFLDAVRVFSASRSIGLVSYLSEIRNLFQNGEFPFFANYAAFSSNWTKLRSLGLPILLPLRAKNDLFCSNNHRLSTGRWFFCVLRSRSQKVTVF